MYKKLSAARIVAMKEKDGIAKAFYSTFKGEIDKEAKDKQIEPTDEMIQVIAKKMAKNIKDNIALYVKSGVDASKEQKELVIISEYLPQVLSEDDTRTAIQVIINDYPTKLGDGLGPLMGIIKEKLGNTVDMKLASKIARELFN